MSADVRPKRRSFVQSLLSLPTGNKAQSAGNMPAIMETNREVNKDWNPIHESWLPSAMTTQYLQQDINKQGKSSEQGEGRSSPALSQGRPVGDRGKLTQSLDANLGTGFDNSSFQFHEEEPRRASIGEGSIATPHKRSALYESDPSGATARRKKRGFWKALKRILHLPTVTKVKGVPHGQDGEGNKRMSFARRISLGSRGNNTARSLKDAWRRSSGGGNSAKSQRMQSMPVMPDIVMDSSDGASMSSRQSEQSRMRGGSRSRGKAGVDHAQPRLRGSEVVLPATPQPADSRMYLEDTPSPSNELGRARQGDSSGAATPDAFRGMNAGLGSPGELIDTTELRAALAQRKTLRESQISQAGDGEAGSGRSRRRRPLEQLDTTLGRPRTMMAGKWQKNFTEGTSGGRVDDLLQVSSLQRLARERIVEMEIVETEETFEMVWRIPLNGSASKISKTDRYLKNGEVVEAARRDGRPGVLRSQLTFTPEGHVHIRALQGEPFSAVFHDRIKLSTGGRRIKIEQKFQLLQPGVLPVKHHSIWNRIE